MMIDDSVELNKVCLYMGRVGEQFAELDRYWASAVLVAESRMKSKE